MIEGRSVPFENSFKKSGVFDAIYRVNFSKNTWLFSDYKIVPCVLNLLMDGFIYADTMNP